MGVVQFDTTKNQFVAAVDDFSIKFWDMDHLCLPISRLMFTNSGDAILVLASNAINLLWKWLRNERNSGGKTTTSVSPVLWQPSSGILMTNDVQEPNHEEAVTCFALSKNACYVISTSGGKISLFNMMTFKRVRTFMPPPPAATYIAFHPQDNNIIAIGMDNSAIQIYNVRLDEVKSKLKGHSKRITGIAFSHLLNVLVSSGADSQSCVWSTVGREMQRARSLQLRGDRYLNQIPEHSFIRIKLISLLCMRHRLQYMKQQS
ncbi:protein TOPLESS-like isoform X3 [Solanum stenotomum]|uniref:protein TOPLESS-like isoform X3 n=1 Tax=Solanum stenotomum TaxID=172797 RepID=UPI0020D17E36|nr:protein TOPLESS-like isoform X3 [Solanum stenotomum]